MPMHGVASHEIKSHHVQEISNGCTWIRCVIDTSISLETVRKLGILDILVSHARPFISFWVVHCEISYGRQVGYRTVYTAKFCIIKEVENRLLPQCKKRFKATFLIAKADSSIRKALQRDTEFTEQERVAYLREGKLFALRCTTGPTNR